MSPKFDKRMIDALRDRVGKEMSDFRFRHTLGVEKMAVKLGELYCCDKIDVLRCAALLHDVTKELSLDEHIAIYKRFGLAPTTEELCAPATLHSVTASLIIPERYSDFADEEIIGAVRYHTVGRGNMTLCEKLIYLADYIDETRAYDDCVALREMFFSAEPEKMCENDRIIHLMRVILRSFDMTVSDILKNGRVLSVETVKARNGIIYELENYERK